MDRTILVVDDEKDMLQLLKRSLEPDLKCQVITASSSEDALKIYSENNFDLVLLDIKMPGKNGLELLEIIKKNSPDQTVMMMTAYGSIDIAVAALKSGAYDFITKPFDHDTLLLRMEKALERSTLVRENQRLQKACQGKNVFQDMVGKSAVMQRVYETIRMVAKNDLTVLITGESGTGKDLTARAIHALSPRSDKPWVAVNCPTVPENILESELFGYKKGAFTHAVCNKTGLFQEADHGSIFLDEIGDVSPAIQTKLLRVLQEKEIKPLGDNKTIHVDVRIISSTNQDLKAKIKTGQFREDFYYRINVLPIELPPLRRRREDIPLIANHLLEKHCRELKKPLKKISVELMDIFLKRTWEGNIRELENVILQGILFSGTDEIKASDVGLEKGVAPNKEAQSGIKEIPYKIAKEEILRRFNADYIGHYLHKCRGNVTRAAKLCGLERQALQQIMRRYDIRANNFRS
ncbi:MAG: sigma-54 dependent transcriptional regulator [Desulfobacterales bacterium]